MAHNINLHIGNLPPGVWAIILAIVLMVVGKISEIALLFWLGVTILAVFGIGIIIELLRNILE